MSSPPRSADQLPSENWSELGRIIKAFEAAWHAWQRVRKDHPEATEFSAGMSGDMEAAIRHGSGCVRVGTALLGGRRLASP